MKKAEQFMKDKSGKVLEPGDLIVYGHALGRCAGLQYGKVLSVTKKMNAYDEEYWTLRVQGVNADFEGYFGHKLNKPGTLLYGDRILIVRRDQIPEKTLKLLDKVDVPTG